MTYVRVNYLDGGRAWTSGWASGNRTTGASYISKPSVNSHQVSY